VIRPRGTGDTRERKISFDRRKFRKMDRFGKEKLPIAETPQSGERLALRCCPPLHYPTVRVRNRGAIKGFAMACRWRYLRITQRRPLLPSSPPETSSLQEIHRADHTPSEFMHAVVQALQKRLDDPSPESRSASKRRQFRSRLAWQVAGSAVFVAFSETSCGR